MNYHVSPNEFEYNKNLMKSFISKKDAHNDKFYIVKNQAMSGSTLDDNTFCSITVLVISSYKYQFGFIFCT